MSEIKNIMDALGRGSTEGYVKGTHLGTILAYLQQRKTEKMRATLAKLSLVCGMNRRYIRENYLDGLEEYGVIETKTFNNELTWNWIGERAFEKFTPKNNPELKETDK